MTITPEVLQLILITLISIIVPTLVVQIRRRQVVPIPSQLHDCRRIVAEYREVEKRLSLVLLGDRIALEDVVVLTYDVLGVGVDDLPGSGRREKVVNLLLRARREGQLLLVWATLLHSRPDLASVLLGKEL